MSRKKWILTDASRDLSLTDFAISSADVPGTPPGWNIHKQTLQSGLSDGVEVLSVDNGKLRFSLLLTRGMGVSHAELNGTCWGWKSPIQGPVHPRNVSLSNSHGKGWLDGFTELMCRCGLESNGAPVFDEHQHLVYSLHGKIANLPASYVELSVDEVAGKISVLGGVEESRFDVQKLRLQSTFTTDFNSHSFQWLDEVVNLSESPATMQMIYHINIGIPLLEKGARLIAPIQAIAPYDGVAATAGVANWHTYDGPRPDSSKHSFLAELLADDTGTTQVLLRNSIGDRGVSIEFDKSRLPFFTQWRNTASEADGYVTSFEPGTNFPNPRPFEEKHNRVVRLCPQGSWSTSVQMNLHTSKEDVEKAQSAISAIQGNIKPVLHDQPVPEWSALPVTNQ